MILSYLKLILRMIAGLAIGLACCLMIVGYIYNELSYDNFHDNAKNIYRVGAYFDLGKTQTHVAVSNYPIGPALQENYPEVENSVRFRRYLYRTLIRFEDKKFFEKRIFFSEASVFDVFNLNLLVGNKNTVLNSAYSVIISASMAKKYFGQQDPIGKVIDIDNGAKFNVTGIFEELPQNSHMKFDMLCSFKTLEKWHPKQVEQWVGDFGNYTYILLEPDADFKILEAKIPELVDQHIGHILKTIGGNIEFFLQPLLNIHLHSSVREELEINGNILFIYIFGAIALFILILACINFINLTTSRFTNRTREIGVRKVLGSHRLKVITQLLMESFIYTFIAMIFAIILVELLAPVFENIFHIGIQMQYFDVPWIIPTLVLFTFLVSILAGIYPALMLSSFKSVYLLRRQYASPLSGSRFRNILVITQFVISITLIIATLTVLNQLHFLTNKNLGFNKDQVLVLPILDNSIRKSMSQIKSKLTAYPDVLAVTFASHIPSHGARYNAYLPEGFSPDESQLIGKMSVDEDFLKVLNIELKEGSFFTKENPAQMQSGVIINEAAVADIGWDQAINKTIAELDDKQEEKNIIGVIKDFHIVSLHDKIMPVLLYFNPGDFGHVMIKINSSNLPQTIDRLRIEWANFEATGTFDYTFLDETFDRQYWAEEKLSKLFSYFAFLAIFIASLGILGLAAYNAEQRTKEIGIRKVLGASASTIVSMLSVKYIGWVLLANIIAWPLSWYAMDRWLSNFAYREPQDIWIFITGALIAVIIAVLTVSSQTIRAAVANPADALKYE